MDVQTLMQRSVATVRPEERLHQGASLLRDRDCGSVVVIDGKRRPVGMLTDRDVCLAALRTEKPLAEIPVTAAMSARLFTCRPDTSIEEAERTMSLHQVRRLPVLSEQGQLVGLIALDDIAREACREDGLLAPPVSCASVGRTLGQIVRPHLITGDHAEEAP